MQQATKIKILTKVTIAAVVVAVMSVAFGIGQYREKNMMAYAQANNCEWVFSSYIDRDPICK